MHAQDFGKGIGRENPGESCGITDVARSPLDALEIDAVEQHDQVGGGDRHAGRLGLAARGEPEGAFFETLVEDEKSVGIPEQELDAITSPISEDEEVTLRQEARERRTAYRSKPFFGILRVANPAR